MTKPMKATEAYATLHSKLASEVRSEPVEADPEPDAGPYMHCLLSAQAALCALPTHLLSEHDRIDILNVIKNLGMLSRRIAQ